jgi:hypothetical protein
MKDDSCRFEDKFLSPERTKTKQNIKTQTNTWRITVGGQHRQKVNKLVVVRICNPSYRRGISKKISV